MIAQELEVSLHMAFIEARQKRHEFISVEHLLLAMLDNPTAAQVLRACAANIDELRKLLSDFVAEHTPSVAGTEDVDTQPTLGFQRVIQRAILHVQSSGKKEVTGANVLVAIFAERESHAAYFLQEQDMTRYDAVNYISHGIAKRAGLSDTLRELRLHSLVVNGPRLAVRRDPAGALYVAGIKLSGRPGDGALSRATTACTDSKRDFCVFNKAWCSPCSWFIKSDVAFSRALCSS